MVVVQYFGVVRWRFDGGSGGSSFSQTPIGLGIWLIKSRPLAHGPSIHSFDIDIDTDDRDSYRP